MKLKHSIFLMMFFCSVLPIAIWMTFSVYDTQSKTEEIVVQNIEAIAGSQAMNIQNFCENRMESMATIARMELVRSSIINYPTNGHSTELDIFLKDNEKYKAFVASLSVVDANFNIVGSSESYEVYGISDFADSDPQNHTGEFVMGNAYERETDKGIKRIVPSYIGIYDGDKLIGYLIQENDCEYFNRLRVQTDFLEDGTLYLTDGNNNLITAGTGSEEESRAEKVTTPEERKSYQEAWEAFDHENNSRGVIHYEYNNQKYITYFSDIKYTDWSIRITENITSQLKSNHKFYLVLITEMLIMIAMLVIVQLIITRKLVSPLNRVVGTLKDVQNKHDYSIRTGVRRKDEVGVVADGIDELLEYIEQEELEEKRRHREFAEEALKKAEASNQAKSTFLFNASHDIRTPMNAIKGFTHIIEQNPDDTDIVMDSVQKIKKSSDTLLELLNNVLELSKIESGKDVQEIQAVSLTDFTDKMHIMFAQDMADSGIKFSIENDIKDVNVLADELKCTRIMMNMLGNARKFTPQGESVKFGIKQCSVTENGKASYYFYVKDTGIGMSKAFQEKAFEQFETERSSTVSKASGSGLGLAIIKRLVEQLGGECMLESESERGTEIGAMLELEVTEMPEASKEESEKVSVDFSGKRVLMVEDNEFNREIARYILEDSGIIVDEAEDGVVAVEKLKKSDAGCYDFILMDIQMPNMDGYETTKAIRSMTDTAITDIPIIAMTANAFKEDVDKCMEVGMNAHIPKPFDIDKLFDELGKILYKA